MRLRLLALPVLVAAALGCLPAHASEAYDRVCGGTVDVTCRHYSCRAVDCFWYDCEVFVDLHLGGDTALCII